jgi:hypothetical protein
MPPLARALALAVTGAVLCGGMAGAAGDIGVALVRGDGRLQPLASLGGDGWTPLAAGEAAGPWHLWLFDDPAVKASPFTMRAARPATAVVAAGAACLPLSGLQAGILPAPGATTGAPPPIALALRGTEARPDVPVRIAAATDLATELTAKAAAAFHRAEDEVLTLEAEQLPPGFPRFAIRRERPITWTLIARQGVAQGTTKTFYFEGRKDYDGFRGRTDIGQIRTTGHVFMQIHGDRATIDAEVDLSDVEGRQSLFRTPIVALGLSERALWLFAARGPDGAHLEIVELTSGASGPRSVWQGPDGCDREK